MTDLLASNGQHRQVPYEKELNPEQLAAVMHPGGPMLVLAGAGTGKTRTLTYRVSRLIEDGVPPGKILLLTFTNKAAKEMLDRVATLVPQGGGRVFGGTYHSAGHKILRRYAEQVGYTSRFSILDREDATDLMGHALADVEQEIPNRRSPRPRLLVDLYSFVINTGKDLETVVLDRAPQYTDLVDTMAAVFRRYLERKRESDLMDFDDLLLNWLLLLKKHPAVRGELCRRFEHILVDEYQDTNRLQSDIVDAMTGAEKNLMVVGDDAQSIYRFRGAEFDNILGFPDRHPECSIFRLERNYRSRPEILQTANACIAHNDRQFKKTLTAVRSSGDRPRSVSMQTPEAQAEFIADEVLKLRDEGIELEEMAVLYRNHSHSIDVQVELTRRNIPFKIRSGLRFFEQRHIKDVLAHLRFVDNPRDEVSFARLMKLRRGFGPRITARLWDQLGPRNRLDTLKETRVEQLKLPRNAARELGPAAKLLEDLRGPRLQDQPGESVRYVIEQFYREWARDNLENAMSRLEDLEQLALFADTHPDRPTFLAEVGLLNELSGEDSAAGPPDEFLTLSTTHRAKGLEWRVVFVIWVSEGRFPGPRCDDIEEERRLFYVALTRAKDTLFLCHPQIARDRYRVDITIDPSRFLLEIPKELFREIVVKPKLAPIDAELELPAPRYELPAFLSDDEKDPDPVN